MALCGSREFDGVFRKLKRIAIACFDVFSLRFDAVKRGLKGEFQIP